MKIQHEVIGAGEEVARGKTIVASVRTFLNQGTEVTSTISGGPIVCIDLRKREVIAGLRYGVEGMRVGGRRTLIISPHLAYGAEGVPGLIPPNAVLRCEVELLEVREPGATLPEDYPPGKHLTIFHPGEAACNLVRWQFDLQEDGRWGATITRAVPGLPWRHARREMRTGQFDRATAEKLLNDAATLPAILPNDCLDTSQLWADQSERGNSITRTREGVLCVTIGVHERGQWVCYYSLAETSRAWLESKLLAVMNTIVDSPTTGDPPK